MEHQWNEIDRGKPKYSEKTLSQCHFVHHKSHMERPGLHCERPAANRLSHGTALLHLCNLSVFFFSCECYMGSDTYSVTSVASLNCNS
jgi:hypothetical protein